MYKRELSEQKKNLQFNFYVQQDSGITLFYSVYVCVYIFIYVYVC